MNLRNLTFILILFTLNVSLMTAQVTPLCPAPAPSSITMQEYGENYIQVRWEAVIAAQSYKVTVTNQSGDTINERVVFDNEFTQEGLSPDREYTFKVASSYCIAGPFGNPILGKAKTSIIIIDDIVQFNCPTPPSSSQSKPNRSITNIGLNVESKSCIMIHVETTSLNPNISFDIGLMLNDEKQLVIGNYVDNPPGFQLNKNDNGSVVGAYPSSNDLGLIPIFKLNTGNANSGSLDALFTWKQDVIITITTCSNCEFDTGSNLISYEQNGNTPLSAYPNPVKNQLNIDLPAKGQIQIFDIAGRIWHTDKHNSNQANELKLIVSDWPSGTYIIKWQSENQAPKTQYFLKLD